MNKIMNISKWGVTVIRVLYIVLPVLTLGQWLFVDTNFVQGLIKEGMILSPIQGPEGVIELWKMNWTFLSKMMAALSAAIGVAPIYISLFILKSIFSNYGLGNIFTMKNAQSYKQLGVLFFTYGLISLPLSETIKILALTVGNGVGHRYLTVSFGTPSIEALFCGFIVILVSLVMQEASQINDENAYTV